MLKALCNVSADEEDCGHLHTCANEKGHPGGTHICKCGTFFMSMKKPNLEKPLEKVQ